MKTLVRYTKCGLKDLLFFTHKNKKIKKRTTAKYLLCDIFYFQDWAIQHLPRVLIFNISHSILSIQFHSFCFGHNSYCTEPAFQSFSLGAAQCFSVNVQQCSLFPPGTLMEPVCQNRGERFVTFASISRSCLVMSFVCLSWASVFFLNNFRCKDMLW